MADTTAAMSIRPVRAWETPLGRRSGLGRRGLLLGRGARSTGCLAMGAPRVPAARRWTAGDQPKPTTGRSGRGRTGPASWVASPRARTPRRSPTPYGWPGRGEAAADRRRAASRLARPAGRARWRAARRGGRGGAWCRPGSRCSPARRTPASGSWWPSGSGAGVVGFATTGPSEDPDARAGVDGEVDQFWIDPPARRQGHGSRLLNACADTLRADGFSRARWWALVPDVELRRFLAGRGLGAGRRDPHDRLRRTVRCGSSSSGCTRRCAPEDPAGPRAGAGAQRRIGMSAPAEPDVQAVVLGVDRADPQLEGDALERDRLHHGLDQLLGDDVGQGVARHLDGGVGQRDRLVADVERQPTGDRRLDRQAVEAAGRPRG